MDKAKNLHYKAIHSMLCCSIDSSTAVPTTAAVSLSGSHSEGLCMHMAARSPNDGEFICVCFTVSGSTCTGRGCAPSLGRYLSAPTLIFKSQPLVLVKEEERGGGKGRLNAIVSSLLSLFASRASLSLSE